MPLSRIRGLCLPQWEASDLMFSAWIDKRSLGFKPLTCKAPKLTKWLLSHFNLDEKKKKKCDPDTIRGILSQVQAVFHLGINPPSVRFRRIPPSRTVCSQGGNKGNITFHRQQTVAMTTSHWCHRKRVTLLELHRLRYPRILLFPSEAAAGPLSPGVHLPFCGEVAEE